MIDVGIVTNTELDQDIILGQIDGYGEKDAGVLPAPLQMPYGLVSRPLDPELDDQGNIDPDKSCQAVYWWIGGRLQMMPTYDRRVMEKLPQVGKGEAMLHSSTGAFVKCGSDGSISISTSDNNDPSGNSIFLRIATDALEFVAPWGRIRYDAFGFRILDASGATFRLGGMTLASYCTIDTDVITLAGITRIGIGPAYFPAISAISPAVQPAVPLDAAKSIPQLAGNANLYISVP